VGPILKQIHVETFPSYYSLVVQGFSRKFRLTH